MQNVTKPQLTADHQTDATPKKKATPKKSFGSCRMSCSRRDDSDYRREYYDLSVNEALRLAAVLQEANGHVVSHDDRNKERIIRLYLKGDNPANLSLYVSLETAARK